MFNAGPLPRFIRFCINRGRVKNIYIYNSEVAAADMNAQYAAGEGWLNTEYETAAGEVLNTLLACDTSSASDEGYTEWQPIDYANGKTIVGMKANIDKYLYNFNFVLGEAVEPILGTTVVFDDMTTPPFTATGAEIVVNAAFTASNSLGIITDSTILINY